MERIGEYLVRRLVGEGGMGKVYEAEERLSHRRVALKVLRPELAKSEEGRRLFLNEMTILAHMDHENIVRCLACAEVEDQLVMALEYLEGRTLRDVLNERGAMPWEEAIGIVVQIAAALAAAHRQEPPIVHRDLKPENVMILGDGGVKVMDFGIAKVLQALSRSTTHSVGTLQYMSPEQIDAGKIDGRSDLYCLGLVLYELLAGKPPFESASPRELLNLQCTAAPPALPEDVRRALPKGVERLLVELLQKSPDDRPGSAADVLHDLEPFAPASAGARPARASKKVSEPAASTPKPEASPSADDKSDKPEKKPRADTIALVEKAAAPREVPTRVAILVVLLVSVIAGLVTYIVRVSSAGDDTEQDRPAASAERDRGGVSRP
jgi:eukaryotic-like serine/threonine-protein kinase